MTSSEVRDNHTKSDQITFGLDLIESALLHVEFLHQIDRRPCLLSGTFLDNAIRRYETLWLPLLIENEGKILVAPLDIQWSWHCHVLAPNAYKKDCMHKFGKMINHKLLTHSERKSFATDTEKLWVEKYPAEPFYVDLPLGLSHNEEKVNVGQAVNYESKFEYDIRSAALRQGTFYYNVSLPHYRDRHYLSIALLRYKKFLQLKILHKDTFIVPCYDIDLMWHTHQLFPFVYREDTKRILGYVLNHDDSTTDRSPGSFLTVSYQTTCKLWKEAFGENYQLPGAMYRGTDSRGQMKDLIVNQNDLKYSDDKFSVSVACVHFDRNPGGRDSHVHLHFSLNGEDFLKLHGHQLSWTEQQTGNKTFILTKKDSVVLTIEKHVHAHNETIYSKQLSFGDIFRTVVYKTCSDFRHEFQLNVDSVGDCNMFLEGRIRQFQEPLRLKMTFEDFKECTLPSNLESPFDPEEIVESNAAKGSKCHVATHAIRDMQGNSRFKCHVIHSLHNHVTCVHLHQTGNGLVSVLRMIDSNHLPLPNMVTTGMRQEITLLPSVGERALLIKDNYGDSTIMIGRWLSEYENGVSGVMVRGLRIRDDNLGHFFFPGQSANKLEIGDVAVKLTDGELLLVGSSEDIHSNILTLIAFGILVVFVLPRPDKWTKGMPIETKETKKLNLKEAKFLNACGLLIEAPSNFHRNRKR